MRLYNREYNHPININGTRQEERRFKPLYPSDFWFRGVPPSELWCSPLSGAPLRHMIREKVTSIMVLGPVYQNLFVLIDDNDSRPVDPETS